MATHGCPSTLTYNWIQLMTLDRAPWWTDISPALDGGSFEHFKTSVRPPPSLAPSGARRHSPTAVSALCGAQLRSFTVFEPPLSADKNRQCVIVAWQKITHFTDENMGSNVLMTQESRWFIIRYSMLPMCHYKNHLLITMYYKSKTNMLRNILIQILLLQSRCLHNRWRRI